MQQLSPRSARDGEPAKPTRRSAPAPDAIMLLKADHKEAKALFAEFDETHAKAKMLRLARKVCRALTVHTRIEEEIFYPACRKAGVEADLLDEAAVEHDGAKRLIAEIEAGGPEEPLWRAKVTVLAEQIEHHVKEEEQRGGLFAKARAAGVDLRGLGERLAARKRELEAQAAAAEH